jgi:uncharacterized protein (DUF1684 family)
MKYAFGVMLLCLCMGCSRPQWPEPPAIEPAQYLKAYEGWLSDQQNTARESSIIVGIWPIEEGETAFGSDTSLPIVLPASVPGRAGVITRTGNTVSVTPARGVVLQGNEGKPITASTEALYMPMKLGSVQMLVMQMEDGRVFASASDEAHPLLEDFPKVQTYPIDQRWRVAARYDAFEQPKMLPIADVRGGTTAYPAVGRLTFRIGDQEQQLTAFHFPDSKDFFVLFKDATNASTTYGFRMFDAPVVKSGEWTVIDFNVARNPPCAYSPYTTCPLPPAENRLAVGIEAGEKRFPTERGFVQQ